MAYEIKLFSRAQKDFDSLPQNVQVRIYRALKSLARYSSTMKSIKLLHPPLEGYRLRAGAYRIIFTVDKSTIFIHTIRHRKDAYR